MMLDVVLSVYLCICFHFDFLRGDPTETCGERCPDPQVDEGESQGALC